jgi:hypothetical protein
VLTVPSTGLSSRTIEVTWQVHNEGIGTTSRGDWIDTVYLARNADGTEPLSPIYDFQHFGFVEPSGFYERTKDILVPDGITGEIYVVITTARPAKQIYEFLYADNNRTISTPIDIALTPAPDLTVTDIVTVSEADEGTVIDVQWTIHNQGPGDALGSWVDRVYLQRIGNTEAVLLGVFEFDGPVAAGQSYVRSEAVRLPVQTNATYRVVVETNALGDLYEHHATANNKLTDDQELTVRVLPRPDLQVDAINIPAEVLSGGTLSVEYVIINQGTVATQVPTWSDRVYLSLDTNVSSDDIIIGTFPNSSALTPGERYTTTTPAFEIPLRLRGNVYVIVVTDFTKKVEEWPNDNNNTRVQPLFVEPIPLPDLVAEQVVAPNQAIEEATIEVRYTVTNRGSGATQTNQWTDTLWLTRDKNRPHPGQGDILLATLPHTGGLGVLSGYDVVTNVTIPYGLESGTYYIMPWTDPYGVVLEDTLATNINPDDPNQIDNNNYKAREITIIAPRPDLTVTNLTAPTTAIGGTEAEFAWTVVNAGNGITRPTTWVDRLYLSDNPDPLAFGATSMVVGEVTHDGAMQPDDT